MLMSSGQAVLFRNEVIDDLEEISLNIRKNFDDMDIENVSLYDSIDGIIEDMQEAVFNTIIELEALTFE